MYHAILDIHYINRHTILDVPFFLFLIMPSFCETVIPHFSCLVWLFTPLPQLPSSAWGCPRVGLSSSINFECASSLGLKAINTPMCPFTPAPQGGDVQKGAYHLAPNLRLPLSSLAHPWCDQPCTQSNWKNLGVLLNFISFHTRPT